MPAQAPKTGDAARGRAAASRPMSRTGRFAGVGLPCLIMALIGCSFALVYPLTPYADRLTDQGKIVSYNPLAFVGFMIGIGLFGASYVRMVIASRDTRFTDLKWSIVLTTVALLLAFTMMYPTNAIDVFIYAARSHLLTAHAENPNRALPLAFWEIDPFVRFASKQWADNVSPYGPLWNLIAAPITAFDGDRILVAVLGFKLVNGAALTAIGVFIYRAMLVRAPERALSATLLWLWNPLVLWEGIGNAHNDVIMMLPIAAALWAWETGRIRWMVPLIVASALIKYVAVIMVPVALAAAVRRETTARGRTVLLGTALAWTIVLVWISLYPFYDLAALWLSVREQGARFSSSVGYVVARGGRRLGAGKELAGVVQEAGYALTAGAIVTGTFACWIDPRRLPRTTLAVITIFLLLGTMNFRPWYVIWIVALAPFTASRGTWSRTVVWSLAALLSYGHYVWVRRIWPDATVDWFWFELVGVGIALGPVLFMYVGSAVIQLWSRRRISRQPPIPSTTTDPAR